MQEVSPEQAKAHLPELLQAAVRGETVLITADPTHAVKLVPVSRILGRRTFGSAKGLITIAPDFDDPLPDFAEYR